MNSVAENETRFGITVSDDKLTVTLDVIYKQGKIDALGRDILAELVKLGIKETPSAEGIAEMLEQALAESSEVRGLVLVRGQEVVLPQNGRIVWARDFFSPCFEVDEATGTVNFRKRVGDPAVDEGSLLATVIPPVAGQDGVDVFGKRIAAPKGSVARVRCGANIRYDESSGEYFAKKSGRVRYSSGSLSVDPVLVVQGNVGLDTGDINHPGAVIVEGDVESGVSIKAEGDVEVVGGVESADIETEGSLRVHRGITGVGRRPLKVAGRVRARFVVEASIEAGDDMMVESEMVNAHVKTRASFIMVGGRLVGGEVGAVGNIYVRQAGSEGQVRTVLSIVVDEELAAEIASREKRRKGILESLQKIKATVAPLSAKMDTLKQEVKDALASITAKVPQMQEELGLLESELEELRARILRRGRPQIVVQEVVYPETRLVIHANKLRVMEEIQGPIRAVSGRKGIHIQRPSP